MFNHLHLHTVYSILDGTCRIKDTVKKIKDLGMKAAAITDHGNMFGTIQFYNECKANDIKPVIGCEVYIAPHSRFDKQSVKGEKKAHHLILLCKNAEGYKNLCKLVTTAYTEGFYSKPRIDKELLEKHHEGLVCTSACIAGSLPRFILSGDMAAAEAEVQWYKNLFGEDYYIEVQRHNLEEEKVVNPVLYELAEKYGVKTIATSDCHYINKEDASWHEMILCMQSKDTITNPNHRRFEGGGYYITSPEEMNALFADHPESVNNTQEIVDKCNFDFEFGHIHLPEYEVPEGFADRYSYLRYLAEEGMKKRYGENLTEEKLERMNYELNIINTMGFVGYYLIVWDFINWAKTNGIPVGPGRGSGAGSIVAYAIGITDIDPLRFNLLFERFLNPERVSMPDFDIDFCYERRLEVVDYVTRKYGADHVSQIITFGTMAAKNSIRDMGRVMNYPLPEVDAIAKLISKDPKTTLEKELNGNKEFKTLYDTNPRAKALIDIAMKVEGLPKSISKHAAGVLIADNDITEYAPCMIQDDGAYVIQYTMTELELLGLIKMDFLGLRTLTVISDAEKDIQKINPNFKISEIPLDDVETFKMLSSGDTSGVFQFESEGMTGVLKQLHPTSLEDLTAVISLYRPGPMDSIPEYIKNKKNPENIHYKDEKLKPILDVTYGILVYQEQVQQIFRDLAGFSLGRADIVRRAMGKKKLKVMEEEKKHFLYGMKDEAGNTVIEGAIARGVNPDVCNELMNQMTAFASYAFNKSHAAAYAYISYETAYLKCHYKSQFMAAMLTSILDDTDKVAHYCSTCKSMGIELIPPSVNSSEVKFSSKDGKIVFGLAALKNVGSNIMSSLVDERNANGNFDSFISFVKRMSKTAINKKAYEALIYSGAFDCFGETRATLFASYNSIIEALTSIDTEHTLYKYVDPDFFIPKYEQLPEWNHLEMLKHEKESASIYISGSPLDGYSNVIKTLKLATLNEIKDTFENDLRNIDGKTVSFIGFVNEIEKKISKNGNPFYLVKVETETSDATIMMFNNSFSKSQLTEGTVAMFNVKVESSDDKMRLTCNTAINCTNNIKLLQSKAVYIKPVVQQVTINTIQTERKTTRDLKGYSFKVSNRSEVESILKIAEKYPGTLPLNFFVSETQGFVNKNIKANGSLEFIKEVSDVLGMNKIVCVK